MKEILKYLDKEGIEYTLDSNPSPEKIEMIKKSIERRDKRMRDMKNCFDMGGLDEVLKFINKED
jgi:hypothetical protein